MTTATSSASLEFPYSWKFAVRDSEQNRCTTYIHVYAGLENTLLDANRRRAIATMLRTLPKSDRNELSLELSTAFMDIKPIDRRPEELKDITERTAADYLWWRTLHNFCKLDLFQVYFTANQRNRTKEIHLHFRDEVSNIIYYQ